MLIPASRVPIDADFFVLKTKTGKTAVLPLNGPSGEISNPDLDQRGFERSTIVIGAVERVPSGPLDL